MRPQKPSSWEKLGSGTLALWKAIRVVVAFDDLSDLEGSGVFAGWKAVRRICGTCWREKYELDGVRNEFTPTFSVYFLGLSRNASELSVSQKSSIIPRKDLRAVAAWAATSDSYVILRFSKAIGN